MTRHSTLAMGLSLLIGVYLYLYFTRTSSYPVAGQVGATIHANRSRIILTRTDIERIGFAPLILAEGKAARYFNVNFKREHTSDRLAGHTGTAYIKKNGIN